MDVSGVLQMSKSWQFELLCSTTRSTRQVLLLSVPSLFTFQFEYVITSYFSSFCMPAFVSPQHTAVHAMALSSLGQARHRPCCFCSHPFRVCWHATNRPQVGTDFSSLLQFCAALSQPVGIKGMIESFHRLPRSKSLEIS